MVVNERISFLCIYLYLATWLMERLLKNKEPFISAYLFFFIYLTYYQQE